MWGCLLKNSVMALEHSPQGLQDRNQIMEHLVFGQKYLSVVNFSRKLISTCLLVFWLVCRQVLCLPPQLISYSRQVSFRSSRGSKKTSNSWGSILLLSRSSSCSLSLDSFLGSLCCGDGCCQLRAGLCFLRCAHGHISKLH